LHALMHGGVANRIWPLGYQLSNAQDISGATNVTPIRISGRSSSMLKYANDGDMVWVWGVTGNTAANGLFIVKNIAGGDADLYELDGVTPVSGNGAYAGGGWAAPLGYRDWAIARGNTVTGDNNL